MGKRRKAREFAIQVLFHQEFSPGGPDEAFRLIKDNFDSVKSGRDFSILLIKGVYEKKNILDGLISGASRNWKLSRIPHLEKCILRLAVFEILFIEEIPPKVSIDEAVELGKKFSGEESGSFINGVLDNIYNSLIKDGSLA
ncbi:transcription antitermination factor NusB [Thermodesulfobacteriota bacterium]